MLSSSKFSSTVFRSSDVYENVNNPRKSIPRLCANLRIGKEMPQRQVSHCTGNNIRASVFQGARVVSQIRVET
jgi:hypothetical protein